MRRTDYLPFGRPDFTDAEIDAVTRVIRSGWVGMGPETIAFEKELTAFFGAGDVVTVSSCSAALFLSLRVLGIGPGDEVICPSLTWCSSANAAKFLGAEVVFCDVDAETLCVTARTVAPHLTERTRAVIVVHFGGLPADITAIRAGLPDHVALVEDAAHALPARFADGSRVGASENLTCFSFYANKNLSTGEGGAIAVRDAAVARRLRSLRLHGLDADAWARYSQKNTIVAAAPLSELGYKMNYTDLQASLGRVQLRRLASLQKRRADIAQCYVERLPDALDGVRFQAGVLEERHARHLFLVLLPEHLRGAPRQQLIRALREENIGVAVHYMPLHLMPLYGPSASLPVTEDIAERVLTLPISASMDLGDAQSVVDAISRIATGSLS
ncbi:MAG: DegT/DnrJ/EryC1/StrS family aminotransferase [Candidatus Schekmanbacteria bacterium]|nr:DegT/DnrJ/EryC1/StrS family aminotransferase [Candidatus Schekmanbacteria bacterium]